MKRLFKITITFVLLGLLIAPLFVVKASEQFSSLYVEVSSNETVIYNTVVWKNIIANTKTTRPAGSEAGYGSSSPCLADTWYGQQINVLEVPRLAGLDGSQKYKVVAWSCFQEEAWKFSGATAIAQDYEAKHPNEIVLGGINGDFYDWHTTKDYPNCGNGIEVRGGEVIRSVHESGWGLVGVYNTTEEQQLVFSQNATDAEISPNMSLVVYDENDNVVEKIQLEEVNKPELMTGQTAAYFGYLERVYLYDEYGQPVPNNYDEPTIKERIYHEPTLAIGSRYLIEDGELVIYQAAEGTYYGKGVITADSDVDSVPRNSFAIVSNDDHVNSLLATGVKVRVQFDLVGEFAEVTDALGCANPLVENGEWSDYYSDAYYTIRAPRTLIGQKADGTISLITMDGRQIDKNFYGTNQEEIDTVLEQLGVTDAYLLDGGGSSTFFVRENNSFVIKNSPSDGHQRSVSNAFLVVTEKDESVKVSDIALTQNSATFTLDTENIDPRVIKAYVEMGEQRYEFVNGSAVINGLNSNTKYSYLVSYQTRGGEVIPTTTIAAFTTLKQVPTVQLGEFTSDEEYLYPKLIINDPDHALMMARIKVNNRNYNYDLDDDTKVLKIAIPKDATSIDCYVSFAYSLGDRQPNVEGELTLNYALPTGNSTDQPAKGGCSCKSGSVYIMSFGGLALALLILLKRKH